MDRKQIGRVGLSMAINYFTNKGYTILIPLNDTQWYDLVIEKNGKFQTVQCKATQTNNSEIGLRSTGGTKGVEYDNVTNHTELDYLFCVDKDLSMWCIPVGDLIKRLEKTDQDAIIALEDREWGGYEPLEYSEEPMHISKRRECPDCHNGCCEHCTGREIFERKYIIL